MASERTRGTGRDHKFGGDWTSAKLDVLAKYLSAYTKALKEQPSAARPFRKAFIDAFAGTGSRDSRRGDDKAAFDQPNLFADPAERDPEQLLDGSARLALRTEPPFDKYIFIERNAERCVHLEALKLEFPSLAASIEIRQGDANSEIQSLCTRKEWRASRAVLFLDPYGMQVEWPTLQAIAKTKAIDLWLLFPFGIGVNRLLTRSGQIPDGWRRRLTLLLGTDEWYDQFYKVETKHNLFGEPEEQVLKAKMETIGRYCNDRLKTIFAGVAEEPGVLRNSSNNPLYLFCFAVGNERGKVPALRIANSLLRRLR